MDDIRVFAERLLQAHSFPSEGGPVNHRIPHLHQCTDGTLYAKRCPSWGLAKSILDAIEQVAS